MVVVGEETVILGFCGPRKIGIFLEPHGFNIFIQSPTGWPKDFIRVPYLGISVNQKEDRAFCRKSSTSLATICICQGFGRGCCGSAKVSQVS